MQNDFLSIYPLNLQQLCLETNRINFETLFQNPSCDLDHQIFSNHKALGRKYVAISSHLVTQHETKYAQKAVTLWAHQNMRST